MSVAITGADGFLGWHLSCRLAATRGSSRCGWARRLRRSERLASAGRRRHGHPRRRGQPSDQRRSRRAGQRRAGRDSRRGLGGPPGARRLRQLGPGRPRQPLRAGQAPRAEVLAARAARRRRRLPNLFGEHGRPGYNSFVATFCHEIAAGRQPDRDRRRVPLMHAQERQRC